MDNADGSVVVRVNMNTTKAEKNLNKLAAKIESTERKLAEKTTERNQIAEQLREASKEAAEAYANVERLQKELQRSREITSVTGPNISPERFIQETENQKRITEELKEQEKILKQKEAAAERLAVKDTAAVAQQEKIAEELNRQKADAGRVADEIERSNSASAKLAGELNNISKRLDKMGYRISGLVKRLLFYSVITIGARQLRKWFVAIVKSSDETSSAISRLKGALLTMVQPLVDVIIPALVTLLNILTKIATLAAQIISRLFGKTAAQSAEAAKALYDQTEALDGVGSAASDASKSLAGFDEINKLSSETAAETTDASIAPDFALDTVVAEENLDNILGLVKAIAIALLSWKISSALGGGLKNFSGALLFVIGTLEFATSIFDAWTSGVSWDNLQGAIFGLTLAVSGLYVLLGPTAAGIGAIVGGLALLVVGFKDAFTNGWNLKNLFMSIAGLLATGIGIGALTGSFIPALIGGIASLLLAITVATGHGEELLSGVRQSLNGFLEFFKGIFTGDMELAMSGIEDIFGGLKTAANAVLSGIEDLFLSFFDWLDEKTGGRLHGILMFMKGLFSGVFEEVRNAVGNTFDAIQQIFGGFLTFLSGVFTGDWDKAWEGVKDIFKGIWNGIVGILESAVNLIIRGINWLISKLNTIHFDVPDWVPAIGGKTFGINIRPVGEVQIPRLAAGAVIPPNREFMAVLGDQKSGTNIEAPESLIRKIVREEAGGGDNTALLQAILEAIKAGKIMMVDKKVLARVAAEGINDMTIAAGKSVLLL